jgi:hypothetical protein
LAAPFDKLRAIGRKGRRRELRLSPAKAQSLEEQKLQCKNELNSSYQPLRLCALAGVISEPFVTFVVKSSISSPAAAWQWQYCRCKPF